MGVVSGYWGQWMLAGGWDLCPCPLLPRSSWGLGVFTGSQGILWSQRGEGTCPLPPGESPSLGHALGVMVALAPLCSPAR